MKKTVLSIALLGLVNSLQAQELSSGTFSGGLESNSQWYQKDNELGFDPGDTPFRSNNYFNLNYSVGKIKVGAQFESYLPKALLGYSDRFNDNKIATYYAQYQDEKLDITAGNFYDQFGSGLIYRSWEDRQIGINNSTRGLRVAYRPNDYTTIKGIIGKVRRGFEVTDGTIQGIDAETNILRLINNKNESTSTLTGGVSYVGKHEDYSGASEIVPTSVENYGARLNYFGNSGIYSGVEFVYKGKDVIMINGSPSDHLFDGNAFLFNLGYSRKGFGINTTFRRMENMGMYAQRDLSDPSLNTFNEGNINYIPALTRQHDYLLTNIYVYQAQPNINLITRQVGEIGGQVDAYFNLNKGTTLGGKYGTKVAINASYWNGINRKFNDDGETYSAGFFDFGRKFFHDINVEVTKKWSPKWSSILTYQNLYYDKGIIEGGNYNSLLANVVVADVLYKVSDKNSVRMELQHLQTKRDRKNWAAAVLEYSFNYYWNIFISDSWNYGNPIKDKRFQYYSFGGNYTKDATRFSLSYGRQRGGLICVGGVCRYVPENTGVTMGIQHSF